MMFKALRVLHTNGLQVFGEHLQKVKNWSWVGYTLRKYNACKKCRRVGIRIWGTSQNSFRSLYSIAMTSIVIPKWALTTLSLLVLNTLVIIKVNMITSSVIFTYRFLIETYNRYSHIHSVIHTSIMSLNYHKRISSTFDWDVRLR